MSGQWEVVGKSRDKQTGKTKKLSKSEQQKFVDNAPKVEDLLPLAQVKTLYAALDSNKAPPKPVEKAVKTKENEAKKAQKKPKEKKESSVKENNKPPKTIEAAVALITVSDVENVLEVGQLRFAEAPLVWLKGLASWLNTKLPVDHTDNAFTAKSWEYPLCLLAPNVRNEMKNALKKVPESTLQMFYDHCLFSMANDMNKGAPVTGYKMLLQLVASQWPSVGAKDVTKAAELRASYQNRPAIGCSIMWALGLAGFKDLAVGLAVWRDVMLPVYSLRNYTHFVSDYLKQLLARHSTSKALSAKEQYLSILDSVYLTKQAGQVNSELKTHVRSLQNIVCNNHADKLHSLFPALLSRLSLSNPPALKDELLSFLTQCLARDGTQSLSEWRQHYIKHLPQSAILLRHLNSDSNAVSGKLEAKLLKETVKSFKVTNDELTKQKHKTEGLQECTRLCDAFLGKASKGKSFPWKSTLFVLILAIAGAVAFDINSHNGFKNSKTGIFLKDVGALKYGEQAWLRIQEASKVTYRWGEEHVPAYTAKIREVVGPYVAVGLDILTALALQVGASFKLFLQYCADKKPQVEQWVNQYAPGLLESVTVWACTTWDLVRDYGLWIGSLALKYLSVSAAWLRENIFVGQLSPENLQRVTLEALNQTQAFAVQTLSWLNSKTISASSESV